MTVKKCRFFVRFRIDGTSQKPENRHCEEHTRSGSGASATKQSIFMTGGIKDRLLRSLETHQRLAMTNYVCRCIKEECLRCGVTRNDGEEVSCLLFVLD